MQCTLKITRYDPERDRAPHTETYTLEVDPTDRVLDALNRVKWEQDGTLAMRRSCQHGVCGSDAMRINGKNRLACTTLIKDLEQPIVVEPISGLNVVRDLMVDMEPFYAKYRSIKPFLINPEPEPVKERYQSPADHAKTDDTSKCILCAACTTGCPSFWSDPDYVGPAAIVQAHRFIFDSRDEGADERLDVLDGKDGVWRCRTIFNCVEACPREIGIVRAIAEVKQALIKRRLFKRRRKAAR